MAGLRAAKIRTGTRRMTHRIRTMIAPETGANGSGNRPPSAMPVINTTSIHT